MGCGGTEESAGVLAQLFRGHGRAAVGGGRGGQGESGGERGRDGKVGSVGEIGGEWENTIFDFYFVLLYYLV